MIHELSLIHYAKQPFELDRNLVYPQDRYDWQAKPVGLWFSVQGEYDWDWWCRGEDFRLDYLAYEHKIKLNKDANILCMTDPAQLDYFTKKYPLSLGYTFLDNDTHQIDWPAVRKDYQGIIIPFYLWSCRLAQETMWYYGWDCASGCIWDLDAVELFQCITATELV